MYVIIIFRYDGLFLNQVVYILLSIIGIITSISGGPTALYNNTYI